MHAWEFLVAETQDEGLITEVIRPAAVVPEDAARAILMHLTLRDVRLGGVWESEPALWRRFDRSWTDSGGDPQLLGSIQIAYGAPTRYDITIFRATVTREGDAQGMTVQSLCDEALAYGDLSLDTCPRADLRPPPQPFRFDDALE